MNEVGAHSAFETGPKHGAMVSHIVDRLRGDILERRLKPGARLVEGELTQKFAVSRGPVREALGRLAAEGLIEHQPNKGAIVRRLSRREFCETFQIRIALEALAARLAADSPGGRREVFEEAIAPIFEDSARQTSLYWAENSRFHDAVMQYAGNSQLQELVQRLQLTLIMAQVGDAMNAEALAASVREHRAIAAAILAGDAPAAEACARAHLNRAGALAASHLSD